MFCRVSGLAHAGVHVPDDLRVPANNTCTANSVTLALVRWLEPDTRALLRDAHHRPVCPPPFDINHALWKFAKTRSQRGYFTDHMFLRQLDLFPGTDRQARQQSADGHKHAMYDLIRLECIDKFMNCTSIDSDKDTILETITLPFE